MLTLGVVEASPSGTSAVPGVAGLFTSVGWVCPLASGGVRGWASVGVAGVGVPAGGSSLVGASVAGLLTSGVVGASPGEGSAVVSEAALSALSSAGALTSDGRGPRMTQAPLQAGLPRL